MSSQRDIFMITFIARHTRTRRISTFSTEIVVELISGPGSDLRAKSHCALNRVSDNDDVILRVIFPGSELTNMMTEPMTVTHIRLLLLFLLSNCCGKRHMRGHQSSIVDSLVCSPDFEIDI